MARKGLTWKVAVAGGAVLGAGFGSLALAGADTPNPPSTVELQEIDRQLASPGAPLSVLPAPEADVDGSTASVQSAVSVQSPASVQSAASAASAPSAPSPASAPSVRPAPVQPGPAPAPSWDSPASPASAPSVASAPSPASAPSAASIDS